MFKNYLKIAFRNMRRYPGYSAINILGMAIGLACFLFFLLWVQDELSYDRFHENSGRIYRVVQEAELSGRSVNLARTPVNLGPELANFPEVESSVRCWMNPNSTFQFNKKRFNEDIIFTDPEFFKMFSFRMVLGDPATVLAERNSLVMTRSAASRMFGEEDPIGKIIRPDGSGEDYTVTGVLEDIPKQSHLQFDIVMPIVLYSDFINDRMWANWNNPIYTYVMLSPDVPGTSFESKIAGLIMEHAPGTKTSLSLQPLLKIHLYSDFTGDVPGHGEIGAIAIFTIVAIFVILIACMNFMNLTTARSANRAREVGLRKVVGAERVNLIRQFFGETLMLTFIGLVLAVLIVSLLLPQFNRLTEKALSLDPANIVLWIGLIVITFVTGLISGSYPALFLSAFEPVTVMKTGGSGLRGAGFRRILVIVQFSLSIGLIISTLTVSDQVRFILRKDLGFDKQNLLAFEMDQSMRDNFTTIKQEFSLDPRIRETTYASHLLTDVTHVMGNVGWEGKDPNLSVSMNCLLVEANFVRAMGMEVIEGRDFSKEFSTDLGGAFILNEEAVKAMGFEDPIGKKMTYGRFFQGQIVGVVKDFHFKPLQRKVEPMVLVNSDFERFYMYVRIAPGDPSGALEAVRSAWQRVLPNSAFGYAFLSESIDSMYQMEKRLGTLFNIFSVLAIFISCLGLLGLASFMAERRTKEIGIRKVLGASVGNVVFILTKDFTKWILISNLFAWPVAYFFMRRWLENFTYRVHPRISIFVLSGSAALMIAWLTVCFQSVKAALTRPAESMRYE